MTEAALSTDPDAALGKLTVEDVSCSSSRSALADMPISSVSYSRCKEIKCGKCKRKAGGWKDSAIKEIGEGNAENSPYTLESSQNARRS